MKNQLIGALPCILALTGCEPFQPPTALDSLGDSTWSGSLGVYRYTDNGYEFEHDVSVYFGQGNNTALCKYYKDGIFETIPLWYEAGKKQLDIRLDNYFPNGVSATGSLTMTSNYWLANHLKLEGSLSIGDYRHSIRLTLNRKKTK